MRDRVAHLTGKCKVPPCHVLEWNPLMLECIALGKVSTRKKEKSSLPQACLPMSRSTMTGKLSCRTA